MLGLPKLGKLKEKLQVEIYEDIEKAYNQIAKNIQGAANIFKKEDMKTGKIENRDGLVYVIYHTEDINKLCDNPRKNSMAVKAYNKIKHRFLVFENVELLEEAMTEEDIGLDINYIPFPYRYQDVAVLYKLIMNISGCMGDIATLLILLEDNGIDL